MSSLRSQKRSPPPPRGLVAWIFSWFTAGKDEAAAAAHQEQLIDEAISSVKLDQKDVAAVLNKYDMENNQEAYTAEIDSLMKSMIENVDTTLKTVTSTPTVSAEPVIPTFAVATNALKPSKSPRPSRIPKPKSSRNSSHEASSRASQNQLSTS